MSAARKLQMVSVGEGWPAGTLRRQMGPGGVERDGPQSDEDAGLGQKGELALQISRALPDL